MPTAPPDLARKLGIKPGMRVALLHPPKQANDAIRAGAPAGVRWNRSLGTARFDLIFFWPSKAAGLSREFARLQARLEPDEAVWAVMPKAFAAGRRFVQLGMQAQGLRGDLVETTGRYRSRRPITGRLPSFEGSPSR
jgi:hypothetical protein